MKAAALILCALLLAAVVVGGQVSAEESEGEDLAADPGTVMGYVDNGETSVPNAIVELVGDESETYSATSTSPLGFYTVENVAPGTYYATADKDGYNKTPTRTFEVKAGETTWVNITVSEDTGPVADLGTVMGYVDNGVTSVPNATIELVGDESETYSATSTSPLGFYTVENVAPGTYYATADKDGYNKTPTRTFEVKAGETTWVNITMTEQLTWLSGKVTTGGSPVENVLVTLESENGGKFTKTTGNDGRYSIQVPSGEYVIIFSKNGYIEEQIPKVLLPGQENVADMELRKSALPGNTGFIKEYDLPHSLMILGLVLALVTLVSALVLRLRVMVKPELLPRPNDEEAK